MCDTAVVWSMFTDVSEEHDTRKCSIKFYKTAI